MLQLLLEHGAEPNACIRWQDHVGNNALGFACERGYSNCVRLLLKAGADVAMKSTEYIPRHGWVDCTLLQVAAEAGHLQVRPFLDMPVVFSWTCYCVAMQLNVPLSLAAPKLTSLECTGEPMPARNDVLWQTICEALLGHYHPSHLYQSLQFCLQVVDILLAAGASFDCRPEMYSDHKVLDILKEYQIRLRESLKAEVSAPGPAGGFCTAQYDHPCGKYLFSIMTVDFLQRSTSARYMHGLCSDTFW